MGRDRLEQGVSVSAIHNSVELCFQVHGIAGAFDLELGCVRTTLYLNTLEYAPVLSLGG